MKKIKKNNNLCINGIMKEHNSLSGNTIIITENGEKTIKEICETKYSGRVLSYSVDEIDEIKAHNISSNIGAWFEVKTKLGKRLGTSSKHPIWLTKLQYYRQAKDLRVGDNIRITNELNFNHKINFIV